MVTGYKVTDVTFSENETCPTFMIANINPRFDIGYNLSRMEDIVQAAHKGPRPVKWCHRRHP